VLAGLREAMAASSRYGRARAGRSATGPSRALDRLLPGETTRGWPRPHADRGELAALAKDVADTADEVLHAATAAAEQAVAASAGLEVEQRYARPDADRLSQHMLDEYERRRTGATEAAFFDLDKTIIARSSTLVMGRTFMRDGLLSSSTVLRGLYAQAVYQLVGADHEKMEQMRSAALELTRGWEADRVRRLVR
jgi:hypothetical protein